ncbi:PAQR family membrane homeostasis protein TrhA [Salibaculum sp.]|uniref:PAQR family membrane homeostasis protein TrhA n=1 Tax=Salibaculum sp. TaxID=2855480 RepID=UPI002B465469|nr:hemolysin III family protein [Salibaculum sp.]HKL70661.1 hemolysin III family protein [Salibaculum sp.]
MTDRATTRAEVMADAALHMLGIGFAVTGTVVLLIFASGRVDSGTLAGLAVYGGALIASFVVSAFYHLAPWEALRDTLRRIDQAAIYFKIAGTYTPFAVFIGTGFAYGVLTLVWALASIGAVVKLALRKRPGKWAAVMYLVLGWMSLLLAWPLVQLLPFGASVLILAGGITYSVGVILFYWVELRFANAIWHGHVLAASACFFIAISMGTFSLPG